METGQTIAGKYRLNTPLGSGGMASVWSATNVFTDREFAVKFLLPHVASTPEAARRFLLEAKVSARVNHPNIIEVIDVGQTDDGALFLVMELLKGLSLEAAIRRQKPVMKTHEFLRIMGDVARALAAAHQNRVIHRDLKPSNIFLHQDREGQTVAKVLDFGVSKFVNEDGGGMTMVGTILGSPLYMSPEQAVGAEGIDGRTDIFAFGAILFEGLCGERAYSGTNLNALIVAIATTQPKRLEDLAPALPGPLKELVDACMATDKARRLSSFDAVVERLAPVIALLEHSDLRLPSPRRPAADATPVTGSRSRRVSDRPPALSGSGTSVPPHSMPAPNLPAKGTVSASGSSTWPVAHDSVGDKRSRVLVGAGGAGAVLVIGLLVALGHGRAVPHAATGGPEGLPASAPTLGEPPAEPNQANRDEERHGVPVISVEQLPMAGRGAAVASKSGGRLSVAATPGSCAIFVDGSPRGPAPLRSFEIAAGTHRLDCVPPSGSPQAATVTVAEGTEAHYQFTLVQ